MAEQKLKSYEMRIINRPWATGYQAKNVHSAIKMFINDEIYRFKPGTYNIEVKGYEKLFTVTKVLGLSHPPIIEMVKLDDHHQCLGTYCVKKTKPLIKGTRVLRLKFGGKKQIILCEECTLNFFRKIESIREDIVENFFWQKGNYVS